MTLPAQNQKVDRIKDNFRFIGDDCASLSECRQLIRQARERLVDGDGYEGDPFPHHPREKFSGTQDVGSEGISLVRRIRRIVKEHFELSAVWVGFVHLAKREAMPDFCFVSPKDDLSHSWHYDNRGSLRWRSHTAILFLNDDFCGGHFVFRARDSVPEGRICPLPGRLIAFTSGEENTHGVTRVVKGSRYVLGIWFSKDPDFAAVEEKFLQQTSSPNDADLQ